MTAKASLFTARRLPGVGSAAARATAWALCCVIAEIFLNEFFILCFFL